MTLTDHVETTYEGAISQTIDVRDFTRGRFSTAPTSGELTGAVFTLQASVNGVDFFDTATTVSASNISTEHDFEGIAYARVRVSTASSAGATARVTIYAERA